MADALPALAASCRLPRAMPPTLCAEAARLPAGDHAAARRFFAERFAPADRAEGLVTGYFEPEIAGALARSAGHPVPLHAPPPDPRAHDRGAIMDGALAGQGLEIAWLADPVDAFFLHIQGSGRVRLADGGLMRVGYAADNGRAYVPIGRLLAERGAIPRADVTMASIRDWLAADPARAAALMRENPRYIFFRRLPAGDPGAGPPGALGVPLVPGRSIAVDPAHVPDGAAVWLATSDPLDGRPLRRLVFAHDRGAAIRGPGRADLFWGSGDAAGERAGAMRGRGQMTILVPRVRSATQGAITRS